MNKKEAKYDFFISHASEDKEDFVRPLAKELSSRGYKVWYDEFTLKIGDSLSEQIAKGIKESHYGIVVLSENFFDKSWTRKELSALTNKEVISDSEVILPVWLELSVEKVYEYSSLLADKVAVSVKAGEFEKVVEAVEKRVDLFVITNQKVDSIFYDLKNCSSARRKKYLFDIENRIKNISLYFNEYVDSIAAYDVDGWDEAVVELKVKGIQSEYGIPNGVWLVEPDAYLFSDSDIKRAIRLCSKWVDRQLNSTEAIELYALLEEILDADTYFILYGIPHAVAMRSNLANRLIDGIAEIGISDRSELKKYKSAMNSSY